MTQVMPTTRADQATLDKGDPNSIPASSQDARVWLAATADVSNDATLEKGLSGLVSSRNKAAETMFGYTAGEMVGRPVATIIPTVRVDQETLIFARVHNSEKLLHFRTTRPRESGENIPVSIIVAHPCRWADMSGSRSTRAGGRR